MKITLLTVGKIKEKYLRDGIAEYAKRLGKYCRLEILEVADERTPEGASRAEEEQIRRTEGARLLQHVRAGDYVAALAIDGETPDSVGFARKLETLGVQGISSLVFVIGGSLGLSEEVLRRADCRISFSRLTFPHQLMRLIFLEQLYRAFRIIKGEPYHK